MMFGGVALALGGCAEQVQTDPPVARTERPRVVELYRVGMIESRVHFIADGKTVVREEYPPEAQGYSGVLASRAWRRPIPEQWEEFWKVVDRLQMPAWKPEYDQGDLPAGPGGDHLYISDGTYWRTRIFLSGHWRESKGFNAFPTIGQPVRATGDFRTGSSNGVAALEEVFEQLLNERVIGR